MLTAILAMTILITGSMPNTDAAETTVFKSVACDFFSYDNAYSVLGKATGADGGMTEDTDGKAWRCTFTASEGGDKAPKLHFMLIKSETDATAKRIFNEIRGSNEKNLVSRPGRESATKR